MTSSLKNLYSINGIPQVEPSKRILSVKAKPDDLIQKVLKSYKGYMRVSGTKPETLKVTLICKECGAQTIYNYEQILRFYKTGFKSYRGCCCLSGYIDSLNNRKVKETGIVPITAVTKKPEKNTRISVRNKVYNKNCIYMISDELEIVSESL